MILPVSCNFIKTNLKNITLENELFFNAIPKNKFKKR